VLALVLVWAVAAAQERHTWSGSSDEEIRLAYGARFGFVRLDAQSDNYNYTFVMDGQRLAGRFDGTAEGFWHWFAYEHGTHISFTDSNEIEVTAASWAEAAALFESLETTGVTGDLRVRIVVEGEEAALYIDEEDETAPPPPPPPVAAITVGYLRDADANWVVGGAGGAGVAGGAAARDRVGGSFVNTGNAVFRGRVSFEAGLTYQSGFVPEYGVYFLKGSSDQEITLAPGQGLAFHILPNPEGGWTFVFPTLNSNRNDNSPSSFSIFPPPVDHETVQTLKERVYTWYTGYVDPEPDVHYLVVRVRLDSANPGPNNNSGWAYFHFPVPAYFAPAR